LAVGVLLTARDIWLGFFYWPQFRAPERIRFVFLLWAGALLTTAGCWLAFRLRAAGWACVVILAFLGVLAYSYGRWWS
jgi:hypothetical protein